MASHEPPGKVTRLAGIDPLFPTPGLLPLSEPGGHTPPVNVPGLLRPLAATLAVRPPLDAKKHDTNPSRWTENKPTQTSEDGRVVSDTTPIVHTDS
jgi:hypothetical protein